MLDFMQKNVISVFISIFLMALVAPLPARAEAVFQAAAAAGSKASGHLDFSIMIQPSLFLRIGVKAAPKAGASAVHALLMPMPQETEDAAAASNTARISIYGNNGSVQVSSVSTGAAADRAHPFAGPAENLHQTAMTLAAHRKIVNVERDFQHDHADGLSILKTADGGTLAYRAVADRVVYTVVQL